METTRPDASHWTESSAVFAGQELTFTAQHVWRVRIVKSSAVADVGGCARCAHRASSSSGFPRNSCDPLDHSLAAHPLSQVLNTDTNTNELNPTLEEFSVLLWGFDDSHTLRTLLFRAPLPALLGFLQVERSHTSQVQPQGPQALPPQPSPFCGVSR